MNIKNVMMMAAMMQPSPLLKPTATVHQPL